MGYPQSYNSQVPLGRITVTAPGATVLLSVNCGPFAGQVAGADYRNPPVPGGAAEYFMLQADPNNAGNLYLMPRGKTAAGNPTSIMAVLPPGSSIPFPFSAGSGPGLTPENFCLDTDASGTAYGYATLAG